jgi:hypothetical protein
MSDMDSEAAQQLRHGPLAAMFHIARSTSPAAQELAREFMAASDAICAATCSSLSPSELSSVFAQGLSREHLKWLAQEQPPSQALLGELRMGFEVVEQCFPEALDDYRRLVIMAAEQAALAVREPGLFVRGRTTGAERRAIEEIRSFAAECLTSGASEFARARSRIGSSV